MRRLHRTLVTCLSVTVMAGSLPLSASVAAERSAGLAEGSLALISAGDAGDPPGVASRLPAARPVVSHHGRFVVFQSRNQLDATDTNGLEDVFLRDTLEGTTQLVSEVDGVAVGGSGATVSRNGRYVAFLSASPELSSDDTNGDKYDVFVLDMVSGDLTLVSRATDGTQRNRDSDAAVISADGSRVAFLTSARLSTHDHDPKDVETWKQQDVYVHNVATGSTRLVSVKRNGKDFVGAVGLGGISADGRTVGFTWGRSGSHPKTPGGFFVRELSKAGSTLLWSEKILPGGTSDGAPAISANGQVAAFASRSDGIDPDPRYALYDVAVVDLSSGDLTVVSQGVGGRDAHGDSWVPTLSRDGGYVAFASEATNLVRRDGNEVSDAFRVEVGGTAMLVSRGPNGPGNVASAFGGGVAISGDGEHVAFHSYATNLVENDTNASSDVLLWSDVIPRL